MTFYDIDLEKKIESNHELRKINEGTVAKLNKSASCKLAE